MGAPCRSSGRGWFEAGLAWFVVRFFWASKQKHVSNNLLIYYSFYKYVK